MITNFENFLLESSDDIESIVNSSKYITELDKNMYFNIRNKYCKTYLKNRIHFYRGDKSLKGNYYLVNSEQTINQFKFDFNYITTEFISSDLWKSKDLPLKKNSLNMATSGGITSVFANSYYYVIPFDHAKIVCMPYLFGNFRTKLFEEEFGNYYINGPSDMAMLLKDMSNFNEITPNNIEEVIKKLENIFNNPKNLSQWKDRELVIVNNMKKHNMTFREYMEFLFAPENYDIFNYEDINESTINKFATTEYSKRGTYIAEYTDSPVLLVKTNINEHMTNTGRWGNIGAGILPYCKKTKRFLLAFRSSYVLEPHTWGIWGGKIEDNEDVEESAIREFNEETGCNKPIELIPSYIYKERGFTYHNFIGLIEDEFDPELDWENERGLVETEDYKWVTLNELLKIKPKHFGLEKLLDNNINKIINI